MLAAPLGDSVVVGGSSVVDLNPQGADPAFRFLRTLDDRRVISGIFYILRTGAPWRDLPERYGPRTAVYNRYNRWAKAGVWLHVFEALAEKSPHSLHLIDSSIVRTHQHAAGGKRGGEG